MTAEAADAGFFPFAARLVTCADQHLVAFQFVSQAFARRTFFVFALRAGPGQAGDGAAGVAQPDIMIGRSERFFHLPRLGKKFVLFPFIKLAHHRLTFRAFSRMVAVILLAAALKEIEEHKRHGKCQCNPSPE